MRKFIGLLFATASFSTFAQQAIDTVETAQGKMVVYANKTWKFLKDVEFDGVLNKDLNNYISASDLNLALTWDNDVCFTSNSRSDLSRLKDTIHLTLDKDNEFVNPIDGIVTSRYGFRKNRNHNGIDINLNTGDTVRAAFSGKIRYAKYNSGGYGNLVIIRHENGLETLYAHLSKHLVLPNDEIKAGDPIGLGGNTGRSFGAHLHFEVRFYDAPINPEEIIDFAKGELKKQELAVHRGLFRPGAKPSDYYEMHEHDHDNVASVAKPAVATVAKKYYKVRSGDTLSKIANVNNTTIAKICQLNGIKQTTTLQIGRNLRVK